MVFGLFYYYILKDLPSPTRLTSTYLPQSTQIYDRHGTLMYTIYGNRNATFRPLSDLPRHLQQATIVIEDKDFYRHGAIDIRGIIRAVYVTFFQKQLQGGSTITQQLVKNSLLTQDRTLVRKGKEVILSFITETLYSKNKILEMYLNQVPYGGTSYGVEAATQSYFGKNAHDLTLPEAAFIAGLPENPTTYSPFGSRPDLGKKRQELVLLKMYEQKYITKEQFDKAKKEPLAFQKFRDNIKAPHFVLYVKDLLEKKYGKEVVEQGGLRVRTTLDLKVQDFAQQTVASEVAKLTNFRATNGAAVITRPGTGEILAMVGSRGYFDTDTDGNVNVTLSPLQPGSSIKPINYAVGLIKGYTAATPFVDQAVCFPGNPTYCPKNYDGKFHGVVQMRFALGNSFNIPAVQMLKLNGLEAMIATSSAMGIESFKDPSRYGLSLTLGGGEVTMLEMITAYGVFANNGYRVDLNPILRITDKTGKVIEEYTPPPSPIFGEKVLPDGVAFLISNILLDNNARSQSFGTNSLLKIGNQPVSVKTGTTNDYRDNWTIGYTSSPSFAVAVWVGNNDHTPMSGIVSGVTGAAPIWNTLMTHLLEGKKASPPKQPSNVVSKAVCATSGQLLNPSSACPTRTEYFIKGTEPKSPESGKQKVFIDKGTNDLAKPGQTDNVEEREEVIITDPTGNKYCLSCPHPSPSPTP